VALAARRWRVWQECEHAAYEDLELLARASARQETPDEQELTAREQSFRRARGLLSAEELTAWLEQWRLEPRAWRRYLKAEALREQGAGRASSSSAAANGREPGGGGDGEGPAPAPAAANGEAAALAGATWARAVCSGALERAMQHLAAVAAAASARGATLGEHGQLETAQLASWEELYEGFCEGAPTSRALERELELRAIDWTQFELAYIAADDEDVIREAALCVREDGMSVADVARLAGLARERESAELDSIADALKPSLLGARAGSVLGPVMVAERWRLIEVIERRAPSLRDAHVRELATRASVATALQAEVTNRVRWHEHL